MKTEILLVEDDAFFAKLLKRTLQEEWGILVTILDAEQVCAAISTRKIDAVVLHYTINNQLIIDIRKQDLYIPVAVYAPYLSKEMIIEIFELGADIDLRQPFQLEELVIRLKSMISRTRIVRKREKSIEYILGTLIFDYTEMLLTDTKSGLKINLSCKETTLLKCLCNHLNEEATRKEILNEVWGADDFFTGRTMDVYLTRIRKHLRLSENVHLVTRHGKTLMLKVA